MNLIVPPKPVVPVHADGKTCSDCKRIARCKWLLSYTGQETQCDWTPSRFVAKEATP